MNQDELMRIENHAKNGIGLTANQTLRLVEYTQRLLRAIGQANRIMVRAAAGEE